MTKSVSDQVNQPWSGIRDHLEKLESGVLTIEEVVDSVFEKIEQLDSSVNAFTSVLHERARARACFLDQADLNKDSAPLLGVPFGVKNLFDIKNHVTLAGSKINKRNGAALQDALLIRRLENCGAILVGALNMGEYAYDFTGENVHYGNCRNPWDPTRMAGGSSSGSAAAVASNMLPITLGSDTNGSIRVPASLCGIFGLKPTYGRLPRSGTYPFCDSLDHVGPLAQSCDDLAVVYDCLQGFDKTDHACVSRNLEFVAKAAAGTDKSLRIGILEGYFANPQFVDANKAVSFVADALVDDGFSVERCNLKFAEAGRSAAFLITNAEGAALHESRLRSQPEDFDPDTRDRFIAGSLLPASWYIKAQKVRKLFAEEAAALFQSFDVLIAPSTPIRAPKIGQKTMAINGEEVNVRANLGYFTQPISCIGLPSLSVPISSRDRLPIGVQLVAAPWLERHCFEVGFRLQSLGLAVSKRA